MVHPSGATAASSSSSRGGYMLSDRFYSPSHPERQQQAGVHSVGDMFASTSPSVKPSTRWPRCSLF
uniref:Uncharacterized protein n=1 Tax=Oryza barthii TaxID=65489 RepID=A0A0D3HFX1_9ORYZ